jgi:muramoyltetrapeptide carboxypeptidase
MTGRARPRGQDAAFRRPPALRRGDRVAVVAPASPFDRGELEAGVAELARLGFEPVIDERLFARTGFVSGEPALRAAHLIDVWRDPSVRAIVCARGGYGSVQVLACLDPVPFLAEPKVFIGYSDITTLLSWLTLSLGIVSLHGPMVAGRLSHGAARYDEATLLAAVGAAVPIGPLAPDGLEILRPGEASGVLVGGTLTQLMASLGTPFAFDPPAGHVLFLDEVNERPYRLDRLLMQLRLSGLLARAAAIVVNELPGCDEPDGEARGIDVIRDAVREFPGPVVSGFPSGHGPGATLTLPFGVRATVVARGRPSLIVEEPAVE